MMPLTSALCPHISLSIAAAAAVSDIKTGKIGNPLILFGWATGLCIQTVWNDCPVMGQWDAALKNVGIWLAGAAVPLLPGMILHRLGMFGAGDVKLLSVIGGCVGAGGAVRIMAASVFCGAMIALPLMLSVTGVRERILYFTAYIEETFAGGNVHTYRRPPGESLHPEEFHFAVAVFMAALLYMCGAL